VRFRRELTAFRRGGETLVYSISFSEEIISLLRPLFDTGDEKYDPDMIYVYPVGPEIRRSWATNWLQTSITS
jgi:hypothetical protein